MKKFLSKLQSENARQDNHATLESIRPIPSEMSINSGGLKLLAALIIQRNKINHDEASNIVACKDRQVRELENVSNSDQQSQEYRRQYYEELRSQKYLH